MVKLEQNETSQVDFIGVCYFPPAGSSREIDIEAHFHVLGEQVVQFKAEGQIVACGDFNARCGGMSDMDGELSRCCVDMEKNGQGELLVDCMKSCGLVFTNGWQGQDQYTCISSRSVVDYCLVPEDDLMSIENFTVKTMSQCEEELCQDEEGYRIPDHSVLLWDILAEGVLDVPPMPTKVQENNPRRSS